MINCFKKFTYEINQSPMQVISIIESHTQFGNRLVKGNENFVGYIKGKRFKIRHNIYNDENSVMTMKSINPYFCGYIDSEGDHANMIFQLRPNKGAYPFIIVPIIFVLLCLYAFIFQLNVINNFYFIFNIMAIGFFFAFYATAHHACVNMIYLIETIFHDELIDSE